MIDEAKTEIYLAKTASESNCILDNYICSLSNYHQDQHWGALNFPVSENIVEEEKENC